VAFASHIGATTGAVLLLANSVAYSAASEIGADTRVRWSLGERERAETLKNEAIMTKPMPVEQKERAAETAEAKKNEGSGTVPNVTPGQAKDDETKETKELKEAMHQVEEEKGDWAKSH
jgi:hypothetical protein